MRSEKSAWTARVFKTVGAVLACGMLALGLAGCGAPAQTPASGGDAPAKEQTSQEQQATLEVSQVVGDKPAQKVAVPEGATVLDALKASGVDCTIEDSSYGPYVSELDGQKAEGMSGWTYTVNGQVATVGAGSCELSNGDVVEWSYGTYE